MASVLTLQFSQRVVIIVGGLMAASGMLLASLDLSLPWLYLTMGILQGSTLGTYSEFQEALSLFYSLCLVSCSLRNAKIDLSSNAAAVVSNYSKGFYDKSEGSCAD